MWFIIFFMRVGFNFFSNFQKMGWAEYFSEESLQSYYENSTLLFKVFKELVIELYHYSMDF